MVHENLFYIELVYDIPPWHIVLEIKNHNCQFNEAVLKVGEQELECFTGMKKKDDQYNMQSNY